MTITKSGLAIGLVACALTACDGGDAKKKDAAASATAAADGAQPKSRLTQAIASAAANDKPGAGATAGEGPPPAGVFGPGEADLAHGPLAPPKVTLLGAGAEPRVTFASRLEGEGPHTIVVVSSKSTPGKPGPPMEFTVELQFPKDRDAKVLVPATEPMPTSAPTALPEHVATGPRPIGFKVRKVGIAIDGALPKDVLKEIEKLVGTKISATLTDAGSLTEPKIDIPADGRALAAMAEALYEALDLFFSPMPREPIGVGASWMASDRARQSGVPVVRYRVTTLAKLEAGQAHLSVDVRQYAADATTVPKGAPDGAQNMAFESFGKATYARSPSSLTPTAGELGVPVALQLANPSAPGRAGILKTELTAQVTLAGAKK